MVRVFHRDLQVSAISRRLLHIIFHIEKRLHELSLIPDNPASQIVVVEQAPAIQGGCEEIIVYSISVQWKKTLLIRPSQLCPYVQVLENPEHLQRQKSRHRLFLTPALNTHPPFSSCFQKRSVAVSNATKVNSTLLSLMSPDTMLLSKAKQPTTIRYRATILLNPL